MKNSFSKSKCRSRVSYFCFFFKYKEQISIQKTFFMPINILEINVDLEGTRMLKVDNVSLAGGQSSITGSNQISKGEKRETVVREISKRESNVSMPTERQLVEAIDSGNKELKKLETNLRFDIHEKTKQVMVKIVNSDTDEVIRELPPEKILDLVASIMERAGLLIDKRG